MARYKVLRSVANTLGQSFTSLTNYADNDYVLGHLLVRMLATGEDTFQLDLMRGEGFPRALLRRPIRAVCASWSVRFRGVVRSHRTDLRYVRRADLDVHYDLARAAPGPCGPPQAPYECRVCVVDDRGREYRWESAGLWYAESWGPSSRWATALHRSRGWLRRAFRRSHG